MRLVAALVLIALLGCGRSEADPITEPPFEMIHGWELHRTLGVIVHYVIDDQDIFFSHPVIAQFPVPQCNAVQEKKRVLILLTQGSSAWRYEVATFATSYKLPTGEWQPIIQLSRDDIK